MVAAALRSWNSIDMVRATGGRPVGAFLVEGVAIDSRKIKKGQLFVALDGDRFDGHDYVGDALTAGASAAIVSRIPGNISAEAPLLVVDDTAVALRCLGVVARQNSNAQFIGITGSVGKTGTKEMLRTCLSALSSVHVSMESHNNAIGVPFTLANVGQDSDYVVVEMGMNHKGEILELASMVRPHVAMITLIAETHIGNFENLRKIADAKAEIFCGLEGPGTAILNRDDPFYRHLRKVADSKAQNCVTFGRAHDATVRLVEWEFLNNQYVLTVKVAGETICYRMSTPGLHWAYNSLGVIACIYGLGEDVQRAATSLSSFELMQGRGRVYLLKLGARSCKLIDESYNASPTSVSAALKVLGDTKPDCMGRRVAVLGDMLELGKREQALHEGLSGDVVAAGTSVIFTIGSRMLYLREALPPSLRGLHFDTAEEAVKPLLEEIHDGDVVLVKGSFSTQMGFIVSALRNRSKNYEAA
jgi:UDP-N-acetylmuramoyl-tripeptide--D-alanyl-D-alanine ligase